MRNVFVVGPEVRRNTPLEYLCVSWGPELIMIRGADVVSALRTLLQTVPPEEVVCDEDIANQARRLGLAVGRLPEAPHGTKSTLLYLLQVRRMPRRMNLEDTARAMYDAHRLVSAGWGKASNEERLDRH